MHILPLSSFYKTQNLGWYGINKWLNQREEITISYIRIPINQNRRNHGNRKSLLSKHYSNNCCRKSQWRILKLMGKRLRQQRICLQCRRPGLDSWVRKSPGEGNGNSLQYSCLENPMDRGAWRATVHRVAKSRMQLSMQYCFPAHLHHFTCPPPKSRASDFFTFLPVLTIILIWEGGRW